ncbi:MAG: hypothetical protein V4619_00325 [Bacteroidota bacterium]
MKNDDKIFNTGLDIGSNQQVSKYTEAFDNLSRSISGLSKPFNNFSAAVKSLDKDLLKFSDSINKLNNQYGCITTPWYSQTQKKLQNILTAFDI